MTAGRPAAALLLALIALLAGCLTAAPGVAPDGDGARVPTSEWKAALSEPVFDAVVSSVHTLAAEDGTQLSLSLHLPQGLPPDSKLPTLVELTPYQPLDGRKSTPLGTDGIGSGWEDFVLRGAAVVVADARGTGSSEGCLDFGGAADRSDAVVFAEWIRAQPWSNGRIVVDGVSHPGMGAVVMHAAVPGLAGALAHAPVVSYYQDEWLQGAKFENQFNGPAYEAIEAVPSPWLTPENAKAQAAACRGETTLDFSPVEGPFTELWQDRHLGRHVTEGKAPILVTQGFVDQNVHPDHAQMYWDALPAEAPKWLVMGWWYHGYPDMDGHPWADFADVRHRWFDALLFERENGLLAEPRVLVEDSTGTWHESDAWPLAPSETVLLHATADGALVGVAGEAAEASYRDTLGAERGTWRDAHVAFRTEPLEAPRLVNGAPVVELVASSSEAATKWVVYLMDEAPDGSWQRVSHGYADSHSWGPEDEWRPMEPGETYNWTVRLMPTAVVVDAGHRLALVVASQDSAETNGVSEPFYCFDDHRGGCYNPSGILPAESAGRATNTVLAGEGGTRVTLAWVDPAATAKPPA